MADLPRGVIDTEVVVLAGARITRHVSAAQRHRHRVLRLVVEGRVIPVRSPQLDQEYVTALRPRQNSDLVIAFLDRLDKYGQRNYAGLLHHERAALRDCGYPLHDEHLIRTAKGVEDVTIVVE